MACGAAISRDFVAGCPLRRCPPTICRVTLLREPDYPVDHEVRRVRSNGEIKWRGKLVYLGCALAGEPVGLAGDAHGWTVSFGRSCSALSPMAATAWKSPARLWACGHVPQRRGKEFSNELNTEPWCEAAREVMVGPSGSAFRGGLKPFHLVRSKAVVVNVGSKVPGRAGAGGCPEAEWKQTLEDASITIAAELALQGCRPAIRAALARISPSSGVAGWGTPPLGSIQLTASISSLTRASPLLQRATKDAMTKCARTRFPSRSMAFDKAVEGDDVRLDADLFSELALDRLLERLAELDHAAGQGKAAVHGLARPAADEDPGVSKHRCRDRRELAARERAGQPCAVSGMAAGPHHG